MSATTEIVAGPILVADESTRIAKPYTKEDKSRRSRLQVKKNRKDYHYYTLIKAYDCKDGKEIALPKPGSNGEYKTSSDPKACAKKAAGRLIKQAINSRLDQMAKLRHVKAEEIPFKDQDAVYSAVRYEVYMRKVAVVDGRKEETGNAVGYICHVALNKNKETGEPEPKKVEFKKPAKPNEAEKDREVAVVPCKHTTICEGILNPKQFIFPPAPVKEVKEPKATLKEPKTATEPKASKAKATKTPKEPKVGKVTEEESKLSDPIPETPKTVKPAAKKRKVAKDELINFQSDTEDETLPAMPVTVQTPLKKQKTKTDKTKPADVEQPAALPQPDDVTTEVPVEGPDVEEKPKSKKRRSSKKPSTSGDA